MQHSDHPAHVVRFHTSDDARGSFSEAAAPAGASDVSVQLMPLGLAPITSSPAADGTSSAMGSPVASSPVAGAPASTLTQRRPLAAPDATQSRAADSTPRQKLRMIGQLQPQTRHPPYFVVVAVLRG
jgi:hypothetical protein